MIPLAVVAPPVFMAVRQIRANGLNENALVGFTNATIGYNMNDGSFNVDRAKAFWLGEIAGIVVHKVANKTGVNRQLKKLTMGYLGL